MGDRAGQCVQCQAHADCSTVSTPICDGASQGCRACGADAECVAKAATDMSLSPGACMSHDNGRCATSAETIIVSGGDLQAAVSQAISESKGLVLVKGPTDRATYPGPGKLAIIGQGASKPLVAGGSQPGIAITGGELFLRNLTLSNSAPGLSAKNAKLHMQNCEIKCNTGGMLLDGASFVVEDSVVTDNEIATSTIGSYGGILTNAPGSIKTLRNVQVTANKWTGLVCSGPINMQNVTATGNEGGNILPVCQQ